MKLPKKQQNSFTAKTQKDVSKEWKISSLLKDAGRDNSLDPSPVSLSGSPSSIEVMRCQVDGLSEYCRFSSGCLPLAPLSLRLPTFGEASCPIVRRLYRDVYVSELRSRSEAFQQPGEQPWKQSPSFYEP